MQSEKKELSKQFKILIEDLLDNYEQYTAEEKKQVKEVFQKMAELNTILDKYDDESKIDWQDFFAALGDYFSTFHY